MSQQGMRTFSTEFKQAVVLRLEAGERIAAVSEELRIRRKLLYEWRAAYRKLGASGLNRKRGCKPGGARASPDAAPATPAPLTELARAQARIAELERTTRPTAATSSQSHARACSHRARSDLGRRHHLCQAGGAVCLSRRRSRRFFAQGDRLGARRPSRGEPGHRGARHGLDRPKPQARPHPSL